MALLAGGGLVFVHIGDRGGGLTRRDPAMPVADMAAALICLAGPLAEAIACGTACTANRDHAMALRFARRHLADDHDAVEAAMPALEYFADRLLRGYWPAVDRLAAALVAVRRLNDVQCRTVTGIWHAPDPWNFDRLS
jgi:hypothetical protein